MFGSVSKFSVLVLALIMLAPAAILPLAQAAPTPDAGALVSSVQATLSAKLSPSQAHAAQSWDTPGRVVVGFHGDALARSAGVEALAHKYGGKLVRVDSKLDFAVVSVPPAFEEVFEKSALALPTVSYAHRDSVIRTTFTPDDPHYADQWGPAPIGLPPAWDTTTGSHSVMVAVVDTGVDYTHPDLAANYCVSGPDYSNSDSDPMDDFGHGTHVAGTIAGVLNNGVGVAGMGDSCLMAVKVLDGSGSGNFADAASGIVWAADHGANVISMSFGGCPGCDPGEPMTSAMTYAHDQGVLLVAAAGNAYCSPVGYPAAYPEAVAIAALQSPGDTTASFSSCGDKVELAAPGQDIISTAITSGPLSDPSGYMFLSGTSMATPHVSGLAALVWAAHPELSNDQLRCLLDETATDIMDSGRDTHTGFGRVQVDAALAQGACIPLPPGAPTLSGYVTDGAMHVSWTTPTAFGTISNYNLFLDGALLATPDASTHSYDIGGNNGQAYTITISATDEAGEGALSQPLSLTPTPPQSLPFSDDFESGAGSWTTTGLWHLNQDRSQSPSTSYYFGNDNGPGVEDNNYDTGQIEAGDLMTPLIDLTNAPAGTTLSFWDFWAGEGGSWEHPIVQASTSGANGPWTTIYEDSSQNGTGTHSIDLSAYFGATATFRFHWDTIDGAVNNFEGWYVDDVLIGSPLPPSNCDASGPDAYGYTCDVTAYDFYDITATGTPIALGDDQVSDPIALPFSFPYYGTSESSVRISSNGFLTFANDGNPGCCNGQPLPGSLAPNDVIAGFWMDLLPPSGGSITYGPVVTASGPAFGVEWSNVPAFGTGAPQTFEILLFADGSAQVQLASVGGSYQQKAVGIEDCNGANGLQFRQGALSFENVGVAFAAPLVPTGAPCQPDQAPTTTIDSPADGATVSGTITATGTASDPDLGDSVENVYVAIDCWGCNDLGAATSWSTDIDTTQYSNGWHTLIALASDGQQYGSSSIQIDIENAGGNNTPPQLSIASPSEGQTVSGTVAIYGYVSDVDGDAIGLGLAVDGSFWSGPNLWNGSYYEFDVDTNNFADGWHQFCVNASDGQSTTVQCLDLYVQNGAIDQPPVVNITTPVDGQVLSGYVQVEGTMFDPEGESMTLNAYVSSYSNSEWIPLSTTSGSFSGSFNSADFANGNVTICVEAFDTANGQGFDCTYVAVQNGYDNAPVAWFSQPSDGATLSGVADLEGYAYDPDGDVVGNVYVLVDGSTWYYMSGSYPWTGQLDTTSFADGQHTLMVVACNTQCGYDQQISVTFANTAPNTAPVVAISSPAYGATVGGMVTVAGTASDPDAGDSVVLVQVRIDGGAWSDAGGTDPWTYLFDSTTMTSGLHTVQARSFDGTVMSNLASVQLNVQNPHAPTIQVYSPFDGQTANGVIAVSGSAYDQDGDVQSVEVRVDGGAWQQAGGNYGYPNSWTRYVDTQTLTQGLHDIEARATDATGLTSAVALVQIIVDNDGSPALAIDSPTGGSTVRGRMEVTGRAFMPGGSVERVEVSVGYWNNWQTAFGTENWSLPVDTTSMGTFYGLPILVRAYDGNSWSPTQLVYVDVQNGPDVKIGADDIKIVRHPVQTDFANAPNDAGERRTIQVTVHNEGTLPTMAWNVSWLDVHASTSGIANVGGMTYSGLGGAQLPSIPAGGSVTLEFEWDTTGWVGDVRIDANVNTGYDLDYSNNAAHVVSYVVVGGLGGAYI